VAHCGQCGSAVEHGAVGLAMAQWGEPVRTLFSKKAPQPNRLLHDGTAHYCTSDTLCTEHPQKAYLLTESVPDAAVHDSAALADIVHLHQTTERSTSQTSKPASTVEQKQNPGQRLEVKR
jgi:hypothetical protein